MADFSTRIQKACDEPGIFYCNGSLKNEFARGWKAFLAEKTVWGKAWTMRQAELFGTCRALGVLGDAELARKWEKLNKPARTFCARLWVKASSCRSNSTLSRVET